MTDERIVDLCLGLATLVALAAVVSVAYVAGLVFGWL